MENKPLLKPKIDVFFHALFREETKHLAEGLISDILGEPVKVKTLDKDRNASRQTEEEKLGILDLRTELKGGNICNIEILDDPNKKEVFQIMEKKQENKRSSR